MRYILLLTGLLFGTNSFAQLSNPTDLAGWIASQPIIQAKSVQGQTASSRATLITQGNATTMVLPSGFYTMNSDVSGMPYTGTWWLATVNRFENGGGGDQRLTIRVTDLFNYSSVWEGGRYADGSWSGWKQLITDGSAGMNAKANQSDLSSFSANQAQTDQSQNTAINNKADKSTVSSFSASQAQTDQDQNTQINNRATLAQLGMKADTATTAPTSRSLTALQTKLPYLFFGVADGDTTANTGTDNAATFQAQINAAYAQKREFVIPDGIYRYASTITLPGPMTIRRSPNTVLLYTGTGAAISTAYSLRMSGGHSRGTWSMSGQGTSGVTASKVSGVRLLRITPGTGANVTIILEDMAFTRCADFALEINAEGQTLAQPRINAITLTNCRFDRNYEGARLNFFSPDVAQENVVIRNPSFTNTASTGGFFNDAYNAGNGLTVWGRTKNLLLEGGYFKNCGRMGYEFFVGSQSTYEGLPIGTTIRRVYAANSGYFNHSVSSHDLLVEDCEFVSNHPGSYLESFGNNQTFRRVKLRGEAITNTINTPTGTDNFKDGIRVEYCEFWSMTGQKELITIGFSRNGVVQHNILHVNHAMTGTGSRSPIQIQKCAGVLEEDNTIITSGTFAQNIINIQDNVGVRWRRDKIRFEGYTGTYPARLLAIGGNTDLVAEGIKTESDAPLVLPDFFDAYNYTPVKLWRRTWSAGSWTITALKSANTLTTPPASPTVGDGYLVQDGATGAWAGQGRTIAVWLGSDWAFFPVTNAYAWEENVYSPRNYANGMPAVGTVEGETQLLYDGVVWAKNTFTDCDFTAGGRLTKSGSTVPTLGNAILLKTTVKKTGLNLNSTKIGDVISLTQTTDEAVNRLLNPAAGTVADPNALTLATANIVELLKQISIASSTTANSNTFLGRSTGSSSTTGTENTFLGSQVGTNTTGGKRNTFVGFNVGATNTTGENDVYVGSNVGVGVTIGSGNTLFGRNVLSGGSSYSNAAENVVAGQSAAINGIGFYGYNVILGTGAGQNWNGLQRSVILGQNAGSLPASLSATGTRNVWIGEEAGKNLTGTSYTNSILIGYNAGAGRGSLTNALEFGTASTPLSGTLNGSYSVTQGFSSFSVTTTAVIGSGALPTVAVSTSAGTGATATIMTDNGGNAYSFTVMVTTGTGTLGVGPLATISFPSVNGVSVKPSITCARGTYLPVGSDAEGATSFVLKAQAIPNNSSTFYFNVRLDR